jgi:hypothetical protein
MLGPASVRWLSAEFGVGGLAGLIGIEFITALMPVSTTHLVLSSVFDQTYHPLPATCLPFHPRYPPDNPHRHTPLNAIVNSTSLVVATSTTSVSGST